MNVNPFQLGILWVFLVQVVYFLVVVWFVWQFLEVFRSVARSLERISTSFEAGAWSKRPPDSTDS